MSYGAAAEWYQGDWTLRGGIFDLSATPTGGAGSAPGYGLDGTFSKFQIVSEIERRHTLWGQPGAVRVTGFLSRGVMGSFKDAINLFQTTSIRAIIASVARCRSVRCVSMRNFERVRAGI
jgi:high affinity Mn2+ porin